MILWRIRGCLRHKSTYIFTLTGANIYFCPMPGFALFIAYLVFFLWLIGKLNFFRLENIRPNLFRLAFLLKTGAGIAMAFIYTYYYTSRTDADIFRYFDDSKVIFDAFFINITDF